MRLAILFVLLVLCGCESTGKIETSMNPYEIERTSQIKVMIELR